MNEDILKHWLKSEFRYDEWGRGARIWIGDYLFADFENHLDAECFLELIEKLKAENNERTNLRDST